ncbi:MAG: dihydrofolate reductase family protein [Candidatus Eremiobacteraeota bacterium]|nr:dihydrofolate reductase family protein [Candidatus Eremiobacteraeota bacterium]
MGGVGWLDAFQQDNFGFSTFLTTIDTLVMGRTTYDQARSFDYWPYGGKRIIVLTSRPLEPLPEDVEIATGGPEPLAALLASLGDVWIVGGAKTMSAFLQLGAVDRIELFIMPLVLGTGVPMFAGFEIPIALRLEEERAYPSGAVHLTYSIALEQAQADIAVPTGGP